MEDELENTFILLECFTRDIIRGLLKNIDKDISKDEEFWEELQKKYLPALKRLIDKS